MLSQEKIAERYPDTFIIRDGCLYRNTIGNGNGKITKLCNFAPFISVEKTVDDGAEEVKLLTLSGMSPDGNLVETVELSDRPFYVGVQYHPEFKSRPNKPHPLFSEFIKAAAN